MDLYISWNLKQFRTDCGEILYIDMSTQRREPCTPVFFAQKKSRKHPATFLCVFLGYVRKKLAMIDLSTLNDKQRSAVESQSDQVIILAGPGSGK